MPQQAIGNILKKTGKIGNLSREIKKTGMEILEIQGIITIYTYMYIQIYTHQMDTEMTEKIVSEPKNRSTELIHSKQQRERRLNKN